MWKRIRVGEGYFDFLTSKAESGMIHKPVRIGFMESQKGVWRKEIGVFNSPVKIHDISLIIQYGSIQASMQ